MSDGKVKVMVIRELKGYNAMKTHLVPSSVHPEPKNFILRN